MVLWGADMGKSVKTRMTYIDAMKGIAIVLVVFLHSLMNAEKNRDSEYALLMNFLSYLAVPTFFFINGYLYNHKYSLFPIKSIVKKFKTYYIPFVGFSLFFWAFHNVFVYLHLTAEPAYTLKDYAKSFILVFMLHMESKLNGAMWFLRTLLFMVCLYICIDYFFLKIHDRNLRYIILAVVMSIMHIVGKSSICPDAYNLNRVLWDFIFFFFGVVVKEYGIDSMIIKHRTKVFIIGILLFTINCHFFRGGFGVNEHMLDIPGTFCGILAVFALANYRVIFENKLLILFGKASLDIMSLHFLAFKIPSLIYILLRNLGIEKLSDTPVLKGTHGIDFILYVVIGLALCTVEYCLRDNVNKRIKSKRELSRSIYV